MNALESLKEPPPQPVEAEATITAPTVTSLPKPPRAKKGYLY